MKEALERARLELRRAEHLYYVSLKYTRTVDMIKNVLERLISALDESINSLLMKKVEEGKLDKVPELPRLKTELLKKYYSDLTTLEMIDFYLYLRTLQKSQYEALREYRRHVTMTAHTPEKDVDITIDKVGGFYHRVHWYVAHAHTSCGEDEQQLNPKHV